MTTDESIRLSKRLSELGYCSRREADEWITKGWVSVDGVPQTELGAKVTRNQKVSVSSAAKQNQNDKVTILYHKPVGIVSSQPEKSYVEAKTMISPKTHWKEDPSPLSFHSSQLRQLSTAGRLDSDSSGLLVLTQDGRIAKQLIAPDSTMEKEYLVRYSGHLTDEGLRLLNHGLSLDGQALKPAVVTRQNADQLKFILKQGKKRQIRRMCELVGLRVIGLKRVRIGQIRLGNLPRGQWRYLGENERF